jgi:hypothetical protein
VFIFAVSFEALMCEPVTMTALVAGVATYAGATATVAGLGTLGTLSLATTVASGVMAAGGAIKQGQAAKAQAAYQSAVERNNATIAGWQAEDATKRGAIAEQRQRLATSRLAGAQRAAYGSSGVALTSGSPLDVLTDTAMLGELDALTIRSNAEREAYGFRAQQGNLMAQSGLTQMAGRDAVQASYIGAGSSLLSSAATAGDRYQTYKYYRGGR